jgi:hypothetical protein
VSLERTETGNDFVLPRMGDELVSVLFAIVIVAPP